MAAPSFCTVFHSPEEWRCCGPCIWIQKLVTTDPLGTVQVKNAEPGWGPRDTVQFEIAGPAEREEHKNGTFCVGEGEMLSDEWSHLQMI